LSNNGKAVSAIGSQSMLFAVPRFLLFSAFSALSALKKHFHGAGLSFVGSTWKVITRIGQ
jgi:hypothetical protein